MEVFSSDGRFSIPGVLPGSVSITAYAEGFVHEYVGPFAVGVHGVEDVRVVLHRGGRIVGTVVAEDDGHPIEAATVRLGPGGTFVQTGADGSFALASVPAGVHGLFVSAHLDDYVSREVPGIDVPEAGKVGPLRISLRAVDPRAPEKSDYEGIGMRCADWELDGDGYRVSEVHPKGGAHVAGIQPGDLILAADGTLATAVDGDEFISRIKGPDGTLVRLTVRRGAQTFDVNIARRRLSW
jgi:hypothetical protein